MLTDIEKAAVIFVREKEKLWGRDDLQDQIDQGDEFWPTHEYHTLRTAVELKCKTTDLDSLNIEGAN